MGQRKSSESVWGIEPHSDVLSLKHNDSTVRKTISMLFQNFNELLKLTSCVWVLVFNIVRKLRLMTTYRKREKQHKNSSCKQHLIKLLQHNLTHSVRKKDQKILWLNSNSLAAISHSDVEDTRLAAVIQRVDDAILWTNLYPADGGMRFVILIRIDPLGSVILPLNNWALFLYTSSLQLRFMMKTLTSAFKKTNSALSLFLP